MRGVNLVSAAGAEFARVSNLHGHRWRSVGESVVTSIKTLGFSLAYPRAQTLDLLTVPCRRGQAPRQATTAGGSSLAGSDDTLGFAILAPLRK